MVDPEVNPSGAVNGVGMTMAQFYAWANGQSCCKCEKKATYFPADTGPCYCDDCFDLIHPKVCFDEPLQVDLREEIYQHCKKKGYAKWTDN